ncbi:MAG: branched-chain amino acid ABC transporter permease, partial [Spirochaetales bacterium]|nr:branched-chain amino acid ABC transporter permease [Spirochaetales bacterium]
MAGKQLKFALWIAAAAACLAVLLWKPTVLIFGVQRAGLYAAVAIPMALVLGIVHIVNLAHGELLMISAYVTYTIAQSLGIDPLLSILPTAVVMGIIGFALYQLTIKNALNAPELNQLILTFGIAIFLTQAITFLYTTQTRKMHLDYVSTSLTIGEISFGIWDFTFVLLAGIMAFGLKTFLTRTDFGKAAVAVGQNPRGAAIVGINVQRVYATVFTLSVVLVSLVGVLFLTRQSIFPAVGGPFTMKSFAMVAMAGIGNIMGILWCALALGLAEA